MIGCVSECNYCVSVYTSDDTFMTSFGTRGSQTGQFDFPTGIAVDNSGLVYVSDLHNHCVQVF